MRAIGLIGGLSWESTVIYYQIINQRVRERLGGSHSANSLIWSIDYTTVENLIFADRWDEVSALLTGAGRKLEELGAGVLLICSNTFSRVSDDVARTASVPVLHIADVVGAEVRARGCARSGCWARASPWSSPSTGTGWPPTASTWSSRGVSSANWSTA
ncbi:aspartate/glutamate racemase family protein [Nonomuraea rubra]|uniref:aspartate/glutamate racemase family protein n=1 Tax=Nonomuraea rubra TaxID=46180 RepID=UPI003610342D